MIMIMIITTTTTTTITPKSTWSLFHHSTAVGTKYTSYSPCLYFVPRFALLAPQPQLPLGVLPYELKEQKVTEVKYSTRTVGEVQTDCLVMHSSKHLLPIA
jgi:hypothetical protein